MEVEGCVGMEGWGGSLVSCIAEWTVRTIGHQTRCDARKCLDRELGMQN